MKKNYKDKLVLVCLDEKFGEMITKNFADSLNLHFANCRELIEYDLFNSGEVLTHCGEEYYLMREKKVIKSACGYENAVMFSSYDIYFHNKEIFGRECTKIYLKLPKKSLSSEESVNKLDFDARDSFLENECDIIIKLKNLSHKNAIKEIFKVLGGIE